MAKSIEERYLAEQKQAEIDHHQPTAERWRTMFWQIYAC